MEYDAFKDLIVLQQEEEEKERREAWNQARQAALKELEQHLKADESSASLVLMDDNYHLRGMRKKIHHLFLQY